MISVCVCMWGAELDSIGAGSSVSTGPAHEAPNVSVVDAAPQSGADSLKARRQGFAKRARESVRQKPTSDNSSNIVVPKSVVDNFANAHKLGGVGGSFFTLRDYIKRLLHAKNSSGEVNRAAECAKLSSLWEWYMTKGTAASLTAAADKVKCRVDELKWYARRLASIIIHHDFAAREQVEYHASQARGKVRLVYSSTNLDDETPMPLSVVQQMDVPEDFKQTVSEDTKTLAIQSADAPKWSVAKSRSKTVAKLVQSNTGYSFLHSDDAFENFSSYRGNQITWIQLTDSAGAEAGLAGDLVRSAQTTHIDNFGFLSRTVTYDGHSGLKKKEREWIRRQPRFVLLYTICELHSLANDQTDSFLKKPEGKYDVDGTNNFAKTVNPGMRFLRFGQACRAVLRHRLQICEGTVPRTGRAYKYQLLRLCVGTGTKIVETLAALKTLPNGDWQPLGQFIVWMPIGSRYSTERVIRIVTETTASTLCGSRFSRWRDKRWVGAGAAYDEQLLFEGVNGLRTLSFVAFNEVENGKPMRAALEAVDKFIEGVSNPTPCAALPPLLHAAEDDQPDRTQPGAADEMGQAERDAAEGKKLMGSVLQYLNTLPFGRSVIIRQVIQLFAKAVRTLLYWSSQKFEAIESRRKQRAGANVEPFKLARKYAVVEAVTRVIETKFHHMAHALLDTSDLWDNILPARDRTVTNCSLAFEMISGSECSMEHSIGTQHRKCPHRNFLLLTSRAAAAELDGFRECGRSGWGKEFKAFADRHGGIQGKVAWEATEHLAGDVAVTTSLIESLHACLRRILFTHGVQTHTADLDTLIAEWVCQRARTRADLDYFRAPVEETTVTCGPTDGTATKSDDTDEGKKAKNPWNLYMRRTALGVHPSHQDLYAISAGYHALGDAELSELRETCATGLGFGPSAKEARRKLEQERSRALLDKLRADGSLAVASQERFALDKKSLAINAAARAVNDPSHNSLVDIVKAAKRETRTIAMEQTHLAKLDKGALLEWRATTGAEISKSFARDLGMQTYTQDVLAVWSGANGSGTKHSPPRDTYRNTARVLFDARASNLGPAADKHWKTLIRSIISKECQPIQEVRPRRVTLTQPPPCDLVCLCSERGRLAHRFRWLFTLEVKRQCPPNTMHREYLEQRRVVVEIIKMGFKANADNPWDRELAQSSGECQGGAADRWSEPVYFHIGNPVLSPFGFTYKRLKLTEEQDPKEDGEVQLVYSQGAMDNIRFVFLFVREGDR